MTKLQKPDVEIGETEDGKWAAFSLGSPHFLIEGDSRVQVLHRAAAALEFYKQAVEEQGQRQAGTVLRLKNLQPVTKTELAVA